MGSFYTKSFNVLGIILFMSVGVVIFATCNATRSSAVFDELVNYWNKSQIICDQIRFVKHSSSRGFNLFDQPSNLGQKRRLVNLEGARSLIGHSLRVRKSNNGFLNNYGHALRIRRGRQFDNFGHTLRWFEVQYINIKLLLKIFI